MHQRPAYFDGFGVVRSLDNNIARKQHAQKVVMAWQNIKRTGFVESAKAQAFTLKINMEWRKNLYIEQRLFGIG
jgi:hypothetical protein